MIGRHWKTTFLFKWSLSLRGYVELRSFFAHVTWHFDTAKASPANTAALTADSHRKAAKEVYVVGEPIFVDLHLYGLEGHLFASEGDAIFMICGWRKSWRIFNVSIGFRYNCEGLLLPSCLPSRHLVVTSKEGSWPKQPALRWFQL